MATYYQRQTYDRFRLRLWYLLLWEPRVEPYPRLGGGWKWRQAHCVSEWGTYRWDAQVPYERTNACHDEIKGGPRHGWEQNEADHLLSPYHQNTSELDRIPQLRHSLHTHLNLEVLHRSQKQEAKEQEAVAIDPLMQNRKYWAER